MSRFSTVYGLWMGLLCVALACCSSDDNVIQGIHNPRAVEPSTARTRVEAELIPNAQRIREDTTPRWQLGRYAFERGADRLLVVSRITSFEIQPTASQKRKGMKPKRVDKILERVWVTIPLGTQLNEELKLEKLEERFLIGYDEGEVNGEMWVQPNRVLGKVMLLNERADTADVLVDMDVEPKRLPSWSVKGILTVPITRDGLRATMQNDDLLAEYRRIGSNSGKSASGKDKEAASTSATPPATTTKPLVVDTPPPPPPTMETPVKPDPDQEDATVSAGPSVTGRWEGKASRLRVWYQFDPNGTSVYATKRPAAPPAMRYGRYEIQGNVVVLNILKFVVGDVDHYHHVADDPYRTYRFSRSDNTLTLQGDLSELTSANQIQLTKSRFEDMNRVLPRDE